MYFTSTPIQVIEKRNPQRLKTKQVLEESNQSNRGPFDAQNSNGFAPSTRDLNYSQPLSDVKFETLFQPTDLAYHAENFDDTSDDMRQSTESLKHKPDSLDPSVSGLVDLKYPEHSPHRSQGLSWIPAHDHVRRKQLQTIFALCAFYLLFTVAAYNSSYFEATQCDGSARDDWRWWIHSIFSVLSLLGGCLLLRIHLLVTSQPNRRPQQMSCGFALALALGLATAAAVEVLEWVVTLNAGWNADAWPDGARAIARAVSFGSRLALLLDSWGTLVTLPVDSTHIVLPRAPAPQPPRPALAQTTQAPIPSASMPRDPTPSPPGVNSTGALRRGAGGAAAGPGSSVQASIMSSGDNSQRLPMKHIMHFSSDRLFSSERAAAAAAAAAAHPSSGPVGHSPGTASAGAQAPHLFAPHALPPMGGEAEEYIHVTPPPPPPPPPNHTPPPATAQSSAPVVIYPTSSAPIYQPTMPLRVTDDLLPSARSSNSIGAPFPVAPMSLADEALPAPTPGWWHDPQLRPAPPDGHREPGTAARGPPPPLPPLPPRSVAGPARIEGLADFDTYIQSRRQVCPAILRGWPPCD